MTKIPEKGPYIEFRQLIAGAREPSPVSIDPKQDIAILQFTGGTTGTPKAAMLTHANLTANVAQALADDAESRHWGRSGFWRCCPSSMYSR